MTVLAAERTAEGAVPPSVGKENTEAKTVSAAGEIGPPQVQPSVVATEAETQATNLPGEAKKAVKSYTWPMSAKIAKIGRGEGESTQGSTFSAGHEPTQGSAVGAGHE